MEEKNDSSDGCPVCIIGPRHLQNELLAYYIETETGCRCSKNVDLEKLHSDAENGAGWRIMLRDSVGVDFSNPWFGLGNLRNSRCSLVLFNFPANKGLEKKLAELGVKGIFYESDPLDRYKKGVPAILQGELWFSREVMIRSFVAPAEDSPASPEVPLTRREKEVLMLIAAGDSNDDVAQQLYISLHTVKNHVSSIYKKLNVDNRLQAALWAASHL